MRVVGIIARTLFVATLFVASFALPADAQFYKGKTITMVINYGAGGNVDTEGRIVQRHLSKHLDGNPTIIVQNLPGAGGLTAINMVGRGIAGKPDGTTFGFYTLNPIAPIIDDPALQVKYEDSYLIAGFGGWIIAYGRKDIPPGIGKPADMAKATDIFAAGYSTSSTHDTRLRLTLDMMGAKYKVITGFQTAGDVNKAMLQKEVNFTSSSQPGFYTQVLPNLIKPGIAMPMWYYETSGPNGTFNGSASIEALGVRKFTDVYKEAHGKLPSGPKFDAFTIVTDIATKLSRAVMMPPGTPEEAVQQMRAAFEALRDDKEFLDEYEHVIKAKAELVSAKEGEEILARLSEVPAAVKAELKRVANVK
jgi:tripartite-type tricarboxylate transporter receptor subunit TctC